MHCEKCGSLGWDVKDMFVDPLTQHIIGKCCYNPTALPTHTKSCEYETPKYGLAISSEHGIRAALDTGWLKMDFKMSADEITKLVKE